MSKFDELKKLAEAATHGIWTAEPPAEDYERDGGEQYHWSVRAPYSNPPMISYQLCRLSSLNNNEEEDAKFIAAANPAAILELLAIQAQLVKALEKITTEYIRTRAMHDGLKMKDDFSKYEEIMCVENSRTALAAVGAQP